MNTFVYKLVLIDTSSFSNHINYLNNYYDELTVKVVGESVDDVRDKVANFLDNLICDNGDNAEHLIEANTYFRRPVDDGDVGEVDRDFGTLYVSLTEVIEPMWDVVIN